MGAFNKPKPAEPTDETVAKLKPNPLTALPEELQRAAVALAKGYWLLCGHAMARAQNLAPRSPGKPAEPSANALLLILRYQAWMAEALRRHLHTEAVVDMVVEGLTIADCNARHWPYLSPGPAVVVLRHGLRIYTRTRVPDLEARLRQTGDWPLTSAHFG